MIPALLVMGAAAALYFSTRKKQGGMIKPIFKGIDLKRKVINYNLMNPTRSNFTLNSLIADIHIGGNTLATIDLATPFVVKPGDNNLAIPFVLSTAGIIKEVVQLISSGVPQTATLKGIMNVDGFNLPVSEKWKI